MDPHDPKLSPASDISISYPPLIVSQVRVGDIFVRRKRSFAIWARTLWALVAHLILSVGIAVFVLYYMEDRPFSLTYHSAPVKVIEGNATLPFAPTQPEVVTILSSIIVVQKWALAAWVVPLCWRIAIFLMERGGLVHQDLEALIGYRLLTPRTYLKNPTTLLIGTLLVAILAANLSTPILTGSIAWVQTHQLVPNIHTNPARFWDVIGPPSSAVDTYRNVPSRRESYVGYSAGRVNIAWGNDPERGVFKRVDVSVSNSLGKLDVGSTIKNITLPYFQVHSLEWVENTSEIPNFPASGANVAGTVLGPLYRSNPTNITWVPAGFALLIPNTVTQWWKDPMNPTIITERRLLILYYAYDSSSDSSGVYSLTRALPTSAYRLHEEGRYYAFAWVTFSAGAGQCQNNCTISSPYTVQNNTPIELEPNRLTSWALSLAPSVSLSLVAENASIPFPWDNIGDYVEAILIRSYSGSWNVMNHYLSGEIVYSSYVPSVPGLVAVINRSRVYGWLGIQLFVTLLSIVFLVLQIGVTKFPLIGDTSLTGFFLDTSEVWSRDSFDPFANGMLRIEEEGSKMKIKTI